MESSTNDEALWPVYVQVVGQPAPESLGLRIQQLSEMDWVPPWSWYPRDVPHWGLAFSPGDRARAWLAGVPHGQERRMFEGLVQAMRHRRSMLSPLSEDILGQVGRLVHVAVLTTPG